MRGDSLLYVLVDSPLCVQQRDISLENHGDRGFRRTWRWSTEPGAQEDASASAANESTGPGCAHGGSVLLRQSASHY